MRERQIQRVERARSVDVKEIKEVEEGLYRSELVNDRGEERVVLLSPSKVMSSSEDMMYDLFEGYVGKYLLAGAIEDKDFAEELYRGVVAKIVEIDQNIELVEERNDLVEAIKVTESSEVLEAAQSRLNDISQEVPEGVSRQDLVEARNDLEVANRFIVEKIIGSKAEEFSVESKEVEIDEVV